MCLHVMIQSPATILGKPSQSDKRVRLSNVSTMTDIVHEDVGINAECGYRTSSYHLAKLQSVPEKKLTIRAKVLAMQHILFSCIQSFAERKGNNFHLVNMTTPQKC